MKTAHLSVLAILLVAVVALGQDSKPGEYELSQLKESVHRITTQHMYFGLDEKAFNRSGDLVAVAIVKGIPESELTSPATVKEILGILHSAFACPSRCIGDSDNRQPNVTMLLLEHLRTRSSVPMQAEIDQTRDFINLQTKGPK
jgi:hypothetical protein